MTAMRSEENGIRPAFAGKEQEAQKSLRAQRPEEGERSFDLSVPYIFFRSRRGYSFPSVPFAGRSATTTTMHEHDTTESEDEIVNYPRLVRVVRPPEICTDQEKTQDGTGANPLWSVGPTQIRYCGSEERLGLQNPTSITLHMPIPVGPADHPRFSPAPSRDYRWSVQKTGGRTTRTNVCGVIG